MQLGQKVNTISITGNCYSEQKMGAERRKCDMYDTPSMKILKFTVSKIKKEVQERKKDKTITASRYLYSRAECWRKLELLLVGSVHCSLVNGLGQCMTESQS